VYRHASSSFSKHSCRKSLRPIKSLTICATKRYNAFYSQCNEARYWLIVMNNKTCVRAVLPQCGCAVYEYLEKLKSLIKFANYELESGTCAAHEQPVKARHPRDVIS
jgi:hypothetical protein